MTRLPVLFTAVLAALGATTGCKSNEPTSGAPAADVPPAQDGESCDRSAGPAAVELTASDGVQLEADFHPSGTTGGPAVVLLHMIPPHHDKSNYTPAFITALNEAGLSVLNVNRRGAAGSEGEAKDAYEGDKGRLDAAAAHAFVTSSACKVPGDRVGFVGASNGTTTALDYTVAAEAGVRPKALVFLSPGSYTENQNKVSDHVATLGEIPLFIAYPDSEAEWPGAIRELATERWTFQQYDGGEHGTGLFSTHPGSVATIATFLQTNLAAD